MRPGLPKDTIARQSRRIVPASVGTPSRRTPSVRNSARHPTPAKHRALRARRTHEHRPVASTLDRTSLTKPVWRAMPCLRKIFYSCQRTVCSLRPSAPEMSLTVLPAASSADTPFGSPCSSDPAATFTAILSCTVRARNSQGPGSWCFYYLLRFKQRLACHSTPFRASPILSIAWQAAPCRGAQSEHMLLQPMPECKRATSTVLVALSSVRHSSLIPESFAYH